MIRHHLHCAVGGLAGLLLGVAAVAHGQSTGTSVADSVLPPGLTDLVQQLGLPGVLLVLGWWLRGTTLKGVPVVITLSGPLQVVLSEEQLTAIRRSIRRALDTPDTDPDSDDPKRGP